MLLGKINDLLLCFKWCLSRWYSVSASKFKKLHEKRFCFIGTWKAPQHSETGKQLGNFYVLSFHLQYSVSIHSSWGLFLRFDAVNGRRKVTSLGYNLESWRWSTVLAVTKNSQVFKKPIWIAGHTYTDRYIRSQKPLCSKSCMCLNITSCGAIFYKGNYYIVQNCFHCFCWWPCQ